MTNQKKITRREAIKILGATAGASLLANIPAKWSTPQLTKGVLPAHAQTSLCFDLIIHVDSSVALNWYSVTTPDVTDGTPYAALYEEYWNCAGRGGCIQVDFYGTGQVQVLTSASPTPFTLNIPATNAMVVETGTGLYALNGASTTNGCVVFG